MSDSRYSRLAELALGMRARSYTPYSHFTVGAALLTESGKVYCGCNIENAGFTATSCAERTAFFKAVSEGEMKFTAIAIAGGQEGKDPEGFCPPCGVCRQVMREFCRDDFIIILARTPEDYKVCTLGELLPDSFGPDFLS
ncbi:MAG: cytidine deaminase [Oscillospiraceae bacterium]|jgi:cytidine deaminase